jgi:hypothetical protein
MPTPTTPRRELSLATLVRWQAGSGLAFAVFLTAHLVNQLTAPFGATVYDDTQRALRAVYQWPPFEIVFVLLAFALHMVTNVAIGRRRTAKPRTTLRARLHTGTGIFLFVVLVFQHVPAVRGLGWLYGVGPEFHGVASGIVWLPVYFVPYYFALAVTGLFHLTSGIALALPRLGVRLPPTLVGDRSVYVATVLGAVGFAASMAAFSGLLFDIGDPMASPYARLLAQLGLF